jgi:uncharacterized repeat protein (TIGR04138 family)
MFGAIRRALRIGKRKSPPRTDHLHCAGCDYDLFGLSAKGRCPECGKPVLATALVAHSLVRNDLEHPLRQRLGFVASDTGYPIDTYGLVVSSLRFGVRVHARAIERDPSRKSSEAHVSAAGLCDLIRDFTLLRCRGDRARAERLLRGWNILRSEDVGRIVYTMVGLDLMRTREGDREEEFVGRFVVERLFSIRDLFSPAGERSPDDQRERCRRDPAQGDVRYRSGA